MSTTPDLTGYVYKFIQVKIGENWYSGFLLHASKTCITIKDPLLANSIFSSKSVGKRMIVETHKITQGKIYDYIYHNDERGNQCKTLLRW